MTLTTSIRTAQNGAPIAPIAAATVGSDGCDCGPECSCADCGCGC